MLSVHPDVRTVIGRKNETDQDVLQIIWDIPILLSANNRSLWVR